MSKQRTFTTYRIVLDLTVDDGLYGPGPSHPQQWDWAEILDAQKATVVSGERVGVKTLLGNCESCSDPVFDNEGNTTGCGAFHEDCLSDHIRDCKQCRFECGVN